MLQDQSLKVSLFGGLDQEMEEKILPQGKLLKLENARTAKIGALYKRYGFDSLGNETISGPTLESTKKLMNYSDELLCADSSGLYSYIESQDKWVNKGYLSNCNLNRKSVIRNTASQTSSDSAYASGVSVYAWEDSRGGIRASVIDQTTGLALLDDTLIDSDATIPRVRTDGIYMYVFYADTSNTLKMRRLNISDPTSFDAAVTVESNLNGTNKNYDIIYNNRALLLVYYRTANDIRITYLKNDGTEASSLDGYPAPVNLTGTATEALTLTARNEGDINDKIIVYYANSGNTGVIVVNEDFTVATSDSTFTTYTGTCEQIIAIQEESAFKVFFGINNSSQYSIIATECDTGLASPTSSTTWLVSSVMIHSKPFLDSDDNIHFIVSHNSSLQKTYFILKYISVNRAFVTAITARTFAVGNRPRTSHAANVTEIESDSFITSIGVQTKLDSATGDLYALKGVESLFVEFNGQNNFLSSQLGKNLYIGGGALMSYDGGQSVEAGFFLYPEGLSNSITGSAGSIESGTRQYVAVYEWTDNKGELHRSATSLPLSVTNSLNDRNTITIPTLRLTEKSSSYNRTDVSIAIYRTAASGTVFYRVTSLSSPLLNDVKVNSVTYQDGAADTTITANEILYTTGGILDNFVPSSSIAPEKYRNRMYLVDCEDGNEVQYSKTKSNSIAVEFAAEFTLRVDEGLGGVLASSVLDEKLLLFKADSIFVHVGDGPNSLGEQSDFGEPIKVVTDSGCRVPQSVVSTPDGVIFKSDKGFLKLNRSLQIENIGEAVRDYRDLTVSGAALDADQNQVVFTHSDGPTLIYDYRIGEWSVYTIEDKKSVVVWDNALVVCDGSGNVQKQNKTSFKDAGSSYSLKVGTPWYSLADLNGYQRIKLIQILGSRKSNHNLVVKVYYDFRLGVMETFNVDVASVLGSSYYGEGEYYGSDETYGVVDDQYIFEFKPMIQKCTSVRFEIYDLNVEGDTNEGFTVTGLRFVYGVKKGLTKVTGTKRVEGT